MPMTRAELSNHLGIGHSTVRKWETEFSDFLEVDKMARGAGIAKLYNEHDIRVFELIKARRDTGRSYAQIKETLAQDIATDTVVDAPREDSSQLIPQEHLMAVAAKLAATEAAYDQIEQERDYLRDRLSDTEERLREEIAARARLEGELEAGKAKRRK